MFDCNKLIEDFIKPSVGNDSINGWGLNVESYSYDDDVNVVDIDSVLVWNEKLEVLFNDFMGLLFEQSDSLLDMFFHYDISMDDVELFNFEFLKEYMFDIVDGAEKITHINWLVFLMEKDIDSFADITFNYNFNMNKVVIDINKLLDVKKTIIGD